MESLTLISTESFERERNELQRPYWRPVDPLAIATPLVSLSVQSSGIFQVISPRRSQVQEDDVISYYIRNQYGTIEAITKLMSLNPVFPEHGTAEGRYGLDVERFAAIMREGGSCRASPQPQSSTITLNDSGSSDSEQNEQRDHEENGNNGDNTGSGGYDYYDSELDEWMILDNEGKQSPTVDNHDSKDGRIVSFLKRTATDGESMTKAISAFKEAILALHPRLKQEVAELCAITYVVIQDRVVQTVFRDIIQTLEDSEGLDKQRSRRADARLFHVLENFLSAITEMGRIATPQNFDQMFSQLGYRCLSRQAFLQYAGRGLIKITEDFVTELRKKKVDQKDPEFFYSCLFRLSASCSLRLLLEGPRPPPKFFVEYTFAGGPLRVLASPEVMTLDTDCEHSRFIPLSLFIKSLEKQITFIRKNNPDESDATLCQVMESLSFDNLYEFISPASSCTN